MASRRRATRNTLTGTISDIQRRLKYLSSQPAPSRLASQVVGRSNIRARSVSTDQIALDAVTNTQLAFDSVLAEQIKDGSVTTDKILDLQITTNKIQDLQITKDKIADLNVDDNKLAPNAVVTSKIRNDAVTRDKIEGGAVGNGELGNSSVSSGKIQDRAVSGSKIADGAVGTGQIANGAVTNAKIGGTISGSKIGSGINGGNINNRSVSNGKLSGGTRAGVGAGLRKSGNTISVAFGEVAPFTHRHRYEDGYYVRDADNRVLRNFVRQGRFTDNLSSKKFKKDISDHKLVNPKNLLNLSFKKFKYKKKFSVIHTDRNREWMHGYMVEDLQNLGLSEVISYSPEGTPERVDYGLFSALVLELVKLQQEEIDLLQEKIKRLELK